MIVWINTKSHLVKIGKSQTLANILYDLCILTTDNLPKDYKSNDFIDLRVTKSIGYIERFITNKAVINKLFELRDEIQMELTNQYDLGLHQGKDLLGQLNRGEITINDFNKH